MYDVLGTNRLGWQMLQNLDRLSTLGSCGAYCLTLLVFTLGFVRLRHAKLCFKTL